MGSTAVGASVAVGASAAVAEAEAGVAALLRLLRTYEIVFAAWGAEIAGAKIAEAPVVMGVLGTLVPRLSGVLGS